jgi:hypothetical protein
VDVDHGRARIAEADAWLPSLFQSEEPAVLQPGLGASAAASAAALGHWAEDGAAQAAPAVGPATAPRARETPGGPEGVVYLGLNDRTRGTESKVFDGMENATVIEGHGADSEMQGKIMSTDGKTALDLSRDEDVTRFLRESGVGALRTDADGKPLETDEKAAARLAWLETFFVGEVGEDGARTGGLSNSRIVSAVGRATRWPRPLDRCRQRGERYAPEPEGA